MLPFIPVAQSLNHALRDGTQCEGEGQEAKGKRVRTGKRFRWLHG
jgi:hypothetical protein